MAATEKSSCGIMYNILVQSCGIICTILSYNPVCIMCTVVSYNMYLICRVDLVSIICINVIHLYNAVVSCMEFVCVWYLFNSMVSCTILWYNFYAFIHSPFYLSCIINVYMHILLLSS